MEWKIVQFRLYMEFKLTHNN